MRKHTPETNWRPVQANGITHAVFDDGEGPLVLLQHGFPDTPHTWDRVTPRLVEAGFRVVRPWGRGITPSQPAPNGSYRIRDLAEDLAALIPALGEERAIVVGHDWGAAAAWGVGHIAPERVDRLIPVAIPHPNTVVPTPERLWNVRHFLSHKLPDAERRFARNDFERVRTLYERWSPAHDWSEDDFEAVKNAYAAPGCLSAALAYYEQLWTWPFRGKVRCDTVIIGGRTDPVPDVDFEDSCRAVSGPCRVETLPGGHFLHLEHPDAFADLLLDLLQP